MAIDWRKRARQYAEEAGIDPILFERQIGQESGFNPNARSPAGATGIAQIMPGTAQGWGVDPTDPDASLRAAANAMAKYVSQFGSYRDALVAYNAGPGRVGKPLYDETRNYIARIMGGKREPTQVPDRPSPSRLSSSTPQTPRPNIFNTLAQLNAPYSQGNPLQEQLQRGWELLASLRDRNDQQTPPAALLSTPRGGGSTKSVPKGAGLFELYYDPVGGWDPESGSNKNIGPIGGHQHVHVAANPRRTKWILQQAASGRFGPLEVREHPDFDPVDPVHTEGSHHYSEEAGDVSGTDKAERTFVNWLRRKYGLR